MGKDNSPKEKQCCYKADKLINEEQTNKQTKNPRAKTRDAHYTVSMSLQTIALSLSLDSATTLQTLPFVFVALTLDP